MKEKRLDFWGRRGNLLCGLLAQELPDLRRRQGILPLSDGAAPPPALGGGVFVRRTDGILSGDSTPRERLPASLASNPVNEEPGQKSAGEEQARNAAFCQSHCVPSILL